MKDLEKFSEVTKKAAEGFGEVLSILMKNWERRKAEMPQQPKHTQLSGMATYDDGTVITFHPDYPVADRVAPFRGNGMGQVLSDGTFHFVRKPRLRSQSKLIKKLPHGRVSETKDGAVQLTIKIFEDEDVDIAKAIGKEAKEAKKAVEEWMMSPWSPWDVKNEE